MHHENNFKFLATLKTGEHLKDISEKKNIQQQQYFTSDFMVFAQKIPCSFRDGRTFEGFFRK